MDIHENEVLIVIHTLSNAKVKHGGKALHKFLWLILNSTSQIGYFSNAWKLYHRINPGKNHVETLSHIGLVWKNCLVGIILPVQFVYKKISIIYFGRWNLRDFGIYIKDGNLKYLTQNANIFFTKSYKHFLNTQVHASRNFSLTISKSLCYILYSIIWKNACFLNFMINSESSCWNVVC